MCDARDGAPGAERQKYSRKVHALPTASRGSAITGKSAISSIDADIPQKWLTPLGNFDIEQGETPRAVVLATDKAITADSMRINPGSRSLDRFLSLQHVELVVFRGRTDRMTATTPNRR